MDKNKIINEMKDKWFLFFVASVIILSVIWNVLGESVTPRILGLLLVIIAQLLYNLNVKIVDNYEKFLKWFSFVILVLFTTVYIAFSVNEFVIAVNALILSFVIMLLGLLSLHLSNLWKSKDVFVIIIIYIIVALLSIVFFGFLYAMMTDLNSGVEWTSDSSVVSEPWDFIYFSSQTFYSNTIGDIIPTGYSRLIVVFETAFSFILHIIVLGLVIKKVK